VPWDEVHDEAEILEHVLSEGLEDRISARLGHPTSDPHGHPIPPRDGEVSPSRGVAMSDLPAGASATVLEVSDRDPELLRYLGELGLYPGAAVRVVDVAPFGGPLTVTVDAVTRALGREVAASVLVSPERSADSRARS
jgi:DtxR family Mn-dependent transcriptional regulator